MVRLTRLLCAVDFSEGSRHALDFVRMLARLYGAAVSVLYVHRLALPVLAGGGQGRPPQPMALTDAERGHLVERLSDFVAEDRTAGIAIDTLFDEDLVVPRAIVQSAAHATADLIALGTHGHSGFARVVLGSVATTVMKTAVRPVLLVPPPGRDAVPLALHRILCPIDFSPASRRALELASGLAAVAGARLTVLHVLEIPGPLEHEMAGYRHGRFEKARACLHQAVTPALRARVAVDELLLVGHPYREVLRVAAEQQSDLLVMGARGQDAGDALTFGATTQRVVRQSPCPVLTVPDS